MITFILKSTTATEIPNTSTKPASSANQSVNEVFFSYQCYFLRKLLIFAITHTLQVFEVKEVCSRETLLLFLYLI